MGNGVMAIGPQLPRPSSTLPSHRFVTIRMPEMLPTALLSLPPSPAELVVVVAEVMVPAEIAAQIARLRPPTPDGALPSLRWKFE